MQGEDGRAVSEALVQISALEGPWQVELLTDPQGHYEAQLPPGRYRVEVAAEGYLAQRRESIEILSETILSLDFQLSPDAQKQSLLGRQERNPNIFIKKIDLNALRDPIRRRGAHPVYVEFEVVENDYGADFGAPVRQLPFVRAAQASSGWRGSFFFAHQNSALNARPFFNVGPLRASRRHQFGFSLAAPAASHLYWSSQLEGVREAGFVNGNVRVPLPEERRPLSADPLTNQVVAALLQAYPPEAPNLPHVVERQLNTNAERLVQSLDWSLRLDYRPGPRQQLAFRYALTDFQEDPFEFVAGQNPRTDLLPQSFSASYRQGLSPATQWETAFYFDRLRALLVPTERFRSLLRPLGLREVPDISFGGDFSDLSRLGPGAQFPRKRYQNRFAGRLQLAHRRGAHELRWGFLAVRTQLNDLQSDNTRGRFVFGNNFGRTAIENFLHGTPTKFTITLGDLYRGFREWEYAWYLQDQIRLTPTLRLNLGLRYERVSLPREVNGRTRFEFRPDGNNFSPQLGFAWSPSDRSLVVRGGYGISFGRIYPATYQLARFNPPAVRIITISNPTLVDPLAGVDLSEGAQQRSELIRFSPDLVAPYSHQYNLVIQQTVAGRFFVEAGYVGNRTIKLIFPLVTNRARPVPGIPITTATIDERRPDPRFSRILNFINSGMSYYDALKIRLSPHWNFPFHFDLEYVFGKMLSSGYDFITTFNRDVDSISQSEENFQADLKGPGAYDVRNTLSLNYRYQVPPDWLSGSPLGRLLGGWEISANTEYRDGAWFDITTISDAPGFGNVDGEEFDRPNILNPSILGQTVDDPDTSTDIMNPAFFDTRLPPGGRGNLPFRPFRRDAIFNTNLALARSFPLPGETTQLQLKVDFLNAFNHPHFDRPGDVFPSPVFGKIIDTQNKGRVIQFQLRVSF